MTYQFSLIIGIIKAPKFNPWLCGNLAESESSADLQWNKRTQTSYNHMSLLICSVPPCKAPLNCRRLILQLMHRLNRSSYCTFWGWDGGAYCYKSSPLGIFQICSIFFLLKQEKHENKTHIRSSAKVLDVACYSSWNFNPSLKIGTVLTFCIRRKSCRHWNKCNWCRATWLILQKTRSSVLQTINAPLSSLLRGLKFISLMPPLLTAFFLNKPPQGGEREISLHSVLPTEAQTATSDDILKISLASCGQLLWF